MNAEHNYDKTADITGLDKYDLFLIREGLMRKTSLPGNHMLDPVFKENT